MRVKLGLVGWAARREKTRQLLTRTQACTLGGRVHDAVTAVSSALHSAPQREVREVREGEERNR